MLDPGKNGNGRNGKSSKRLADTLGDKPDSGRTGRPSSYHPVAALAVRTMMGNGKSVVACSAALGICKDTFYTWVKEKEDFSDAVKHGLLAAEAWWEGLGRAGMFEKDFKPPAWIFLMKNRFAWADVRKIEQTTEVNVKQEIQVTHKVIQSLGTSDLKHLRRISTGIADSASAS